MTSVTPSDQSLSNLGPVSYTQNRSLNPSENDNPIPQSLPTSLNYSQYQPIPQSYTNSVDPRGLYYSSPPPPPHLLPIDNYNPNGFNYQYTNNNNNNNQTTYISPPPPSPSSAFYSKSLLNDDRAQTPDEVSERPLNTIPSGYTVCPNCSKVVRQGSIPCWAFCCCIMTFPCGLLCLLVSEPTECPTCGWIEE